MSSIGFVLKCSHLKAFSFQSQDVVTENEFEKRLLADVIPPSDIGVTFDDIGALENVKDTLKELVMLPLQRPELFCKGQLTKVFICSLSALDVLLVQSIIWIIVIDLHNLIFDSFSSFGFNVCLIYYLCEGN